ncbi:hypothetical protein R3I94_017909 [Phoxinus phoxinus]
MERRSAKTLPSVQYSVSLGNSSQHLRKVVCNFRFTRTLTVAFNASQTEVKFRLSVNHPLLTQMNFASYMQLLMKITPCTENSEKHIRTKRIQYVPNYPDAYITIV